jgi:holo-[acyl-carrier protein] synthase
MILGIGNDIIEIDRIASNMKRYQQRFLDRVFTQAEQAYCLAKKDPAIHFAGRWAAKEAVAKALGTGFKLGLTWLDIEILNDEHGKPSVFISSSWKETLKEPALWISISHCRHYATAMAIWSQTHKTQN